MKRIAVISGVAGGIGRAAASIFGRRGWHVIGVDIREPDFPASEFFHFQRVNVAEPGEVEALFAGIAASAGRIDTVINNAALQLCKPVADTLPDEWDLVMATNLRSIYLTTRAALPLLERQKGSIVNVSSVHAIATSANIAAYAAAKGGVVALTRALAIELAPRIRVNAVLPGAVDTAMLRAGLERGHVGGNSVDERFEQLAQKTVQGRIGSPGEIAESIYFLADPTSSSFITGQILVVDGGALARLSTE